MRTALLFRFIRQHPHVIVADLDVSAGDMKALRLAAQRDRKRAIPSSLSSAAWPGRTPI